MSLSLHSIKPAYGATHRRKRIGRGNASGHGTYAGKGQKGQRARSGKGRERLRRLGMKALVQSIPKTRGFRSLRLPVFAVNIGILEKRFASGSIVTLKGLKRAGLVQDDQNRVKILGDGKLTKALTVRGCAVSASAKEKIEKAGGKIDI